MFIFTACNSEGKQGMQGEKGEKGEKGIQGESGKNGENGVDGRSLETSVSVENPQIAAQCLTNTYCGKEWLSN
jgi:hypothetical protein